MLSNFVTDNKVINLSSCQDVNNTPKKQLPSPIVLYVLRGLPSEPNLRNRRFFFISDQISLQVSVEYNLEVA